MTKLLILSSDTGEGHNSAAAAIEIAATSAGLQAKIRKPLEESTRFNRALATFYNGLLMYRPQWMGAYFRLINALRPNEREFSYTKVRSYVGRFIEIGESGHSVIGASDDEPLHPAVHQGKAAGDSVLYVFDRPVSTFLAWLEFTLC